MLVLLLLILWWLDTPVEPLRFLQSAIRHHQIVFLGDIHPVAEPKLLVTHLIAAQREDQTIDLLALEVASEQQEWSISISPPDPKMSASWWIIPAPSGRIGESASSTSLFIARCERPRSHPSSHLPGRVIRNTES